MKIISYSLWGNNKRYIEPLLENILIAKELYKGWNIIVYASDSVSNNVIEKLKQHDVMVIQCGESPDSRGMFWRFKALEIPGAETVVFRDSDSLMTEREKAMVELWLNSDKDFYACRDHPFHWRPVICCAWGAKKAGINKIKEIATYDPIYSNYGDDEKYIAKTVYYPYRKDFMIFAPFVVYRGEKPTEIPVPRKNYQDYVGRIHSNEDVAEDEEMKKVLNKGRNKPICRFFIPYSPLWRLVRFVIKKCHLPIKIEEWREFDKKPEPRRP